MKEIVIGVENDDKHKAYRVADIESKKIVNDEIEGKQIALVSLQPFMVRVFDRTVSLENNSNVTLEFEYDSSSNLLIDKQTGTKWNFDGQAIEGKMKGKSLTRLPFDEGFLVQLGCFSSRYVCIWTTVVAAEPSSLTRIEQQQLKEFSCL